MRFDRGPLRRDEVEASVSACLASPVLILATCSSGCAREAYAQPALFACGQPLDHRGIPSVLHCMLRHHLVECHRGQVIGLDVEERWQRYGRGR
jgi:hypothetical protein